jgi:O-methyltransferase
LKLKEFQKHDPTEEEFCSLTPMLAPAVSVAFDYLRTKSPELLRSGAYYEFGIYRGFTLWWAERSTRGLRGPDFRFYGFDSFEGVPESDVDKYWAKGSYCASLEEVSAHLARYGAEVELVKGLFSQTLFKSFWAKHPQPPAVVVIDSDIYESCREVLEFFGPKSVVGTVILFDEINHFQRDQKHGEARALLEFQRNHPSIILEKIFGYSSDGEAYVVTATSGAH